MTIEFQPFPKLHRLNRGIIITEKLDGTNAQIHVDDDGNVRAGSRNRWVTVGADNYGFAAWVAERADVLAERLGPGRHFGEWWGSGIQRGYGLKGNDKRFSLFNVGRWSVDDDGDTPPACCSVVPVLYRGAFDTDAIRDTLEQLRVTGSIAAPGFDNPEGIVVYHVQGRTSYKVTIDGDDAHKYQASA